MTLRVKSRRPGKTPHYMLRWVATTAEKGPWSETASATIGAREMVGGAHPTAE